MPDIPTPVAEFRGKVRILRTPQAPLAVTLIGSSAAPPGEEIQLTFAGSAPPELPEVLEDARVERSGPGTFDVLSGAETFRIEARSVHVHLDVGREFYRAIPGRPVPVLRRLLLSAALLLARSRAGLSLMRALRR
jgi:hypothetical protein